MVYQNRGRIDLYGLSSRRRHSLNGEEQMYEFLPNQEEVIDRLYRLARCYTASSSAQMSLVDLTLRNAAEILIVNPRSSPQVVLFRLMHQLANGELNGADLNNVKFIKPWLESDGRTQMQLVCSAINHGRNQSCRRPTVAAGEFDTNR